MRTIYFAYDLFVLITHCSRSNSIHKGSFCVTSRPHKGFYATNFGRVMLFMVAFGLDTKKRISTEYSSSILIYVTSSEMGSVLLLDVKLFNEQGESHRVLCDESIPFPMCHLHCSIVCTTAEHIAPNFSTLSLESYCVK